MPPSLLEQELAIHNKTTDELLSVAGKELRLHKLEQAIAQIPTLTQNKAELQLGCSTQYLDFQRLDDAWNMAKTAFDFFINHQQWQLAVVACDILVAADKPDSLKALAHGIWLAITFPINPETTTAILQHLIDESPVGSETTAIAAVTAHYIADVRKLNGKAGDNLLFFTQQILAKVAAEHRNISNQQEFDIWMSDNEFNNPDSFLPKLSAAIETLVSDEWWFSRDKIRTEIF